MNRVRWVVPAVGIAGIAAAVALSEWNFQRVSCEARHGVLARTMVGFECVAPQVGVLPISNGAAGTSVTLTKPLAGLPPLRFSSECCGVTSCDCEELTEFVPDLPERLIYHDPSLDVLMPAATQSRPILTFQQPDCKSPGSGAFIRFDDIEGHEILHIDECTGKVVVAHPEKMTRQALKFWGVVEPTWGPICRSGR